MDWRIYYSDGSVFDSNMGSPWEAPGWGVQVIVFADPEIGRALLRGYDYYLYRRESGWVGVQSETCLIECMVNESSQNVDGVLVVKSGRMIARDVYHKITNKAHTDPDFPPKSNTRKDETPVR